MDLLTALLNWCFFGLIVGAIARLLIPGTQPLGILGTIGLGVLGAFAGGFINFMVVGGDPIQSGGWIMSIAGALVVLAIGQYAVRHRSVA